MVATSRSNLPTLVFLGSPEPAVVVLDALVAAGANINLLSHNPTQNVAEDRC